MVIGWLRPVVLVPAGLLAGLTPHQLEAVLAHELAHIRRHDYLVNLLQNIVETFFFYHPAVWWISRQIRTEREHCCDDLAAAVCGSTLDYARALTALAELRHTSGVFGLAATGGSLVNRIARLAGVGNPEPRLGWPLPAFLLTAGTAVAFVATSAASPRGDALKAAPAAKTSPQLIQGHVLDPAGKPVADAAVWLTAWDAKAYPFDGIPIVAQCRSTADGQFVLSLDAATVRQFGRLAMVPGRNLGPQAGIIAGVRASPRRFADTCARNPAQTRGASRRAVLESGWVARHEGPRHANSRPLLRRGDDPTRDPGRARFADGRRRTSRTLRTRAPTRSRCCSFNHPLRASNVACFRIGIGPFRSLPTSCCERRERSKAVWSCPKDPRQTSLPPKSAS